MTERRTHLLTAKQVEGAGDGWHKDGGNLYLRVRGQRRHWVLRWARDGKITEMGLGGSPEVSLAAARQRRDDALKLILEGRNPITEKRKERDARERRKTFADAAAAVIEARKSGWRSDSDRSNTYREWTRHLVRKCKPIAGKFVDEIDVNDIKGVVSPFWDKGLHDTARRLLNRIELVIEYALSHGWRSADNPASWKRFQHIAPAQPKNRAKHHPAMPYRDAPDFMRRLRGEGAMSGLALEFAILTATRSGEARGALWSEIDLDAATWTIPPHRMKTGCEHAVPLSRQAVAVLRKMKAIQTGAFVFPGQREGACIVNESMWKTVKRLAPGVRATTHGFRTSFRSWCGDTGVDREVAEMCLAHKIGSQVEQVYNQARMLEWRRPDMQRWADFLDGKEAAADNVLPLKRA
jgi:integrase